MSGGIDYGKLMHHAMRGLIRTVLEDVQRDGLPGDHHFFVTFDTKHPEVNIATWLQERYPGDMTVVMQHWFEDLEVTDEGFSVTLNFGDAPERLQIPFDAIKTFVDPAVEFGLRFDGHDSEAAPVQELPLKVAETPDDDGTEAEDQSSAEQGSSDESSADAAKAGDDAAGTRKGNEAEVVSLDSFRK